MLTWHILQVLTWQTLLMFCACTVVTTLPSERNVIFSYCDSATPVIERVISAAAGRVNVQLAEPLCVLVLVPPHFASFSMSKRIIDDELVQVPPPDVSNCQSGVRPIDPHPHPEPSPPLEASSTGSHCSGQATPNFLTRLQCVTGTSQNV